MRNWITWLCLLALVLGTGTCSEGGSRTGNAADIPLAMDTIGPAGGTIKVDMPGNPLDGAELAAPENALDEEVEITLLWSRIPIFPDYSELSHSFSEVLKIEPEELAFAVPATVGLPANIPDGTATASPIAFGISKQVDLVEFAFAIDNDFSDDFGSLAAAHAGAYSIGGFVVDASASSLEIVTPTPSMGAHTVTAGSMDPVLIRVDIVGRDTAGNQVDLDQAISDSELPHQFGGMSIPITVVANFDNVDSMVSSLLRTATGDFVFSLDHFEFSQTAGAFPPTNLAGTIDIEAIVQEGVSAPLLIGMCMETNPLCSPVFSLPADSFVAAP